MEQKREYQKVIDYLQEKIKSGELSVGSRLPTERALAEALSIGRNSTREALRTLENTGILESRQGSGNYLVGNTSKTFGSLMETMLLLKQADMEEVAAFRKNLEKAVCMSILEKGTFDRHKADLEKALHDMDTISPSEREEADKRFHFTLIAAAENRIWSCIAEGVANVYRTCIGKVLRSPDETEYELFQTHCDIFSALEKDDRALCEKHIDEHYTIVEKRLAAINRRYTLAIFDLDGTILDTLDDLCGSLNYALAKNGFPMRTKEETMRFVGNGIRNLVRLGMPASSGEEQTEQVYKDFSAHYGEHYADKTKPYDTIIPTLESLVERGIKIAVVSNKADEVVQKLCKKYFDGLINVAVGEKEGVRRKPAPDAVFQVLNSLKIERKHAVYVGDSEVDIMTAANAGVDCISVSWGFRSRDFLFANGAVTAVTTPTELTSAIFAQPIYTAEKGDSIDE